MSNIQTYARPYAKAVYDYALQTSNQTQWLDILSELVVLVQDEMVAQTLKNPALSKDNKVSVLLTLLSSQAQSIASGLIKQLISKNRLNLVPYIYTQYKRLKDLNEGSLSVSVISAFPLTDEKQTELVDKLKAKFAKDIQMTVDIDQSLIGGMIVKTEDGYVFDGSVRGKIQTLAENLQK